MCRCLGLPFVLIAVFFQSETYNCISDIVSNRFAFMLVYGSTFFGIELLALPDILTLTPGNDYVVLVFGWLTLGQTQLIHKLMVLLFYS